MMASGRVSVAIVTFNSAGCIGGCVESVARHLPDASCQLKLKQCGENFR